MKPAKPMWQPIYARALADYQQAEQAWVMSPGEWILQQRFEIARWTLNAVLRAMRQDAGLPVHPDPAVGKEASDGLPV